jgi:hypothetical protein
MTAENSKPSGLAIISIVMPILILLAWCIYIVVFGVLTENTTSLSDNELIGSSLLFGGGSIVGIVTDLLSLVGVVLGVLAIRKNDARKNIAIAGLVINLLCLLPYVLLIILFAFSASGSS